VVQEHEEQGRDHEHVLDAGADAAVARDPEERERERREGGGEADGDRPGEGRQQRQLGEDAQRAGCEQPARVRAPTTRPDAGVGQERPARPPRASPAAFPDASSPSSPGGNVLK
jgi:hypothetical protein